MEDTTMEIEETSPIPRNPHRVALKNSIQTNFGDDYVFQIVHKDDWTSMAVSLSTNTVKLYSPATGQFIGECNKHHSSTINQIMFSGDILRSCSSDGTVRAWDTRSFQEISCISAGPSEEVFCFSFGGVGDSLLAAGCKSQILFWDWRTRKQVACLQESHMDDVTQVHFVPENQNKLVSASVDGLMCIFDTSGQINDDDHLESVINVGTSIGKVGFCGKRNQKLWCLTHIETLSVWDWTDSRLEANFEDARSVASNSWTPEHVDYFVDCHYSYEDDSLWVIGGTNNGTLGYFPVKYNGGREILAPEAVLHGGHTGIIRSILPVSSIKGPASQNRGIFGWTGGEDGRLCCWLSDEACDTNRSWISTTLVMKTTKSLRKKRRQPY
ncbi:hypothetical protein ACET3Z_005772 [Daucus carota]